MEEAIRKELVGLCREIIDEAEDSSLDDQLRKTRLLQEKIILLKYLRFREGEIRGSSSSQSSFDKIDRELEETILMAEQQRQQAEQQASSSSATPITPQASANNFSAVSKPTGMMDEKPEPAGMQPQAEPAEDLSTSEEEQPIAEKPQETPRPQEEAPQPHAVAETKTLAEEEKEPTEAPVEKEKLKEDQPPREAPQAPQREREKPLEKQRSIHQRYSSGGQIKLGLNDRIAFMNHLFEGSQEDLNRVISQLNTFDNYSEAENFILQMVKPDYDWSNKEEYEERLIDMVKARFGEE